MGSRVSFFRKRGNSGHKTSICLQARESGLAVVVLDPHCHHNTRTVSLPKPFFGSAQVFAEKWAYRLSVATSCLVIGEQRRVWVLGSAGTGGRTSRQEMETRLGGKRGFVGTGSPWRLAGEWSRRRGLRRGRGSLGASPRIDLRIMTCSPQSAQRSRSEPGERGKRADSGSAD